MHAWGKAWIAAQELSLRSLDPAWSLNSRGYRMDFNSSILDYARYQFLERLPSLDITAEHFHDEVDYRQVVRAAAQDTFPRLVRNSSGMTGGFLSIISAREFLRTKLFSPRKVLENYYKMDQMRDPKALQVAIHVRHGDFIQSKVPSPGDWKTAIPIDWYVSVMIELASTFPKPIQFAVFTDDTTGKVREALSGLGQLLPEMEIKRPLLSDLLFMAESDFIISSISSFSMLAAFLSSAPYLWYGPHLSEFNGLLSLWGYREGIDKNTTALQKDNLEIYELTRRAFATNVSGFLPNGLISALESKMAARIAHTDLVMHGVIPRVPQGKTGHE